MELLKPEYLVAPRTLFQALQGRGDKLDGSKKMRELPCESWEGSPPLFPLFSLTRFFRLFSLTDSLQSATKLLRHCT